MIFIRFKAFGEKRKYKKETLVLVTNHNSYLDTVVSYIHIRNRFKTLAKKELTKWPLMGQIFLTSGIMVDRSSAESRKQSFERMVNAVKSGTSLLIFPEGTQNRTQETLQDFYDGAFRLAIATQVPLQPIVTINARQLMPNAKFSRIRPGLIRQYFLEPIPTVGMTEDQVDIFKQSVHDLMKSKINELDPTYPN